MSDHDRYLEAIGAHVLGSLEPAEAEALERHLATDCAECNAEMLRRTQDLEAMALALPPVEPSATTRSRTLRDARADSSPAEPVRRSVGTYALWATAAMLALLIWSVSSQSNLRRQVEQLETRRQATLLELGRLQSDLDRANRRIIDYARASRIVASPGMSAVQLAGLEAAPQASAQAFVEDRTGAAVFYASNLAPTEAEQTYQLWVIVAGKPVSAGTFDLDETGGATVLVDTLGADQVIEAWAVTLEPAGGVPQPTGPMVLLGAVST